MIREKILATLIWSAVLIAGAMAGDYLITIVILGAREAYTPFITLTIASVVTVPATFVFVSQRTDLRRARDQLAAARDSAVSSERAKMQFFSNMSHELRTPLNAIIGFSEMLGSDLFVAKRVEYAHLIHKSGKHLLSLVNDLLDLSRIDAGKLELHEEDIDVAELVNECADTVTPRVRERELRLIRSVATDMPMFYADRRAVVQILLNLLTNAVKFTEPGGTVEVFAAIEPSGELVLGVRDEGIGIAEDNLQRVFERFGQARHDAIAIEKGTGLGLPIVKGLVETHGGRVAMTSTLGEGTTVTCRFPSERLRAPKPIALAS